MENLFLRRLGLSNPWFDEAFLSRGNTETTRLERILQMPAKLSAYTSAEKYDEAYGFVETLYHLGPSVNTVNLNVKFYISAVMTDRIDKANEKRDELINIVSEKFNVDGLDALKYAVQLTQRGSKNHILESYLYLQLACFLMKKWTDAERLVRGLGVCITTMGKIVIKMIEESIISNSIISQHFIPQMLKLISQLSEIKPIDRKELCNWEVKCLYFVSACQSLVGDIDAAIEVCEQSLKFFDEYYGNEAEKEPNFKDHTKILAEYYKKKGNWKETAKYLSKTIDAMKKCTGYSSEWIRKRELEKEEKELLEVRLLLEYQE